MECKDLKVLVVDDIDSARKIVIRLLAKLGILNVISASNGEGAIEIMKSEEVDLIISDLHLKDMDCTDVLRKIHETKENFTTPFIVMTSDMNREEFERVIQEGVSAYLLKPFSLKDLETIIKDTLSPNGNQPQLQ
ncbi:MAG: response regulator [Bdellovibrionales bacterium]|nr:response regulator [Bdellovibrionales bacterium]